MRPAPFKSTYAILGVKSGRAALARRLKQFSPFISVKPIRVRVDMTIDRPFSRDNGTSQEFSCTVLSVKEFKR